MRKIVVLFLVFISYTMSASADSPLTSTPFYSAYSDLVSVQTIRNGGGLDSEIALRMVRESTPMDEVAAIINALEWDFNGKHNAEKFVDVLRGARPDLYSQIDTGQEPGRVLFIRGYLMAMDNYFDVAKASRLVEKARKKMPNDFTVALVSTLVLTQDDKTYSWCDRYRMPTQVVKDFSGRQNMRPEAVKIIMDYMNLYASDCHDGG